MNITKKCRQARKLFSAVVIASFLTHQMLFIPVLAASDISNVTGENGVFNIDPTGINKDVGFRKYDQFKLDAGDIANFIMNYDGADIAKFVNLVNNRIDINGIVNTLKADGSFSNGGLVFISPEGMVVGASGVLNVGSLQVMTPTTEDYEKFKGSIQSTPTLYSDLRTLTDSQGTGIVTIAGKVISRDTVDINAAGVNLLESGGIIAGVDHDGKITSLSMGEDLFSQLVNIDGLGASGNSLRNDNGVISITSYGPNEGMSLDGVMKNVSDGTGYIKLTNEGSQGMSLNGEINNNVGTISATNNAGDLTVSGNIINDGKFTQLVNTGDALTVSGDIDNATDLTITNSGTGALLVSGNIYNGNNTILTNNGSNMKVSGRIDNGNGLTLRNTGNGGMEITSNADIDNANGFIKVDNQKGILNIAGNITNTGSVTEIKNSGTSANLSGTINNSERLSIHNTGSGSLNVGGTIDNGGDTYISNSGSGLKVSGTIDNDGYLNVTHTNGSNGLTIANTADITNGGMFDIENNAGALNVGGNIDNNGSRLQINNNGTTATISGVIDNAKNLFIKNDGTGALLISGTVKNGNDATITNNGGDKYTQTGSITNGNNLFITNNAKNGMNFEAGSSITNDGNLYIKNTAGILNMAGTVTNKGTEAMIANSGTSANIGGTINNDQYLEIKNTERYC